jgi:membrane-associated phospholipid phosphatase
VTGATAAGDGRPTRRVLRLERSPFEPAVILRFALAAAILLALTLAAGVPVAGDPPAIDRHLSEATTAPQGTARNALAYGIGRIGHLWFVVAIAAVLAVVARRRSGTWDLGLLLVTVLGGATVLTGLAKLLTDRARPEAATVETLSAAFPSGHSVRAAAVFGLVAWVLRCWSRNEVVRRLIVPLAVIAVLTNGAARVVLGVHWPTDVLAGIALGTVWLLVCLRLLAPAPVEASGPPRALRH